MLGFVGTSDAFKDVLLATLFVNIIAAAVKNDDVEDVAAKAEDRSEEHDLAVDLSRSDQALYSLGKKPDKQAPDNHDAAEGANYISPVVAVGVFESGLLLRHPDGQERDHEASYV